MRYPCLAFNHFLVLASFFWHLGILTIWAFFASLTLWHYEIQKKTALKSKDAKIKATLVFNYVFFWSQDAKMPKKMPKMPKWSKCKDAKKDAKMPKNASPFKKKYKHYQDAQTRETKVTSEISHYAALRNLRCKNYKK